MTEVTAKRKLTQTKSVFPLLFSHRWFAKWPGEDEAHAGRVQLRLTAPELISATPFPSPAKHITEDDTAVSQLHSAAVSAPSSRPGQAGLYLMYESPSSFSHCLYDFISLLTTVKKLIPIAALLGQWKFNILAGNPHLHCSGTPRAADKGSFQQQSREPFTDSSTTSTRSGAVCREGNAEEQYDKPEQ